MQASTRILVVDSDAASQGDVQKFLVSHRLVVLGGVTLGEDTLTMARAFHPQVVLLNLDTGQESFGQADLVARELPEAYVVAYSHRGDIESAARSARVGFDGHRVKVVAAREADLLAAIESALTGEEEEPVEEFTPIAADDGQDERSTPPPGTSPEPVEPTGGHLMRARESQEPLVRHFADVASEWLLTRSRWAEERLLTSLAEDVQAPSFGGRGRDVVRQGLEGLAWRLGSDFRLVPSDLGAEPVLAVVVGARDGHWHRAGHFVVRAADDGTVTYLDYRDGESSDDGEGGPASP
jgi:DNA-binding NarL/FixJ family response regulator